MALKGLQTLVQFLNEMQQRKQQENKSIDSYIYEKLALCWKVNKNIIETNIISHVINGFKLRISEVLNQKNSNS